MNSAQWSGYRRADGRIGVRDIVLVIYTVECASHVAHAIAANEPDVHVIGFPGCYDNAYAIRMLLAFTQHPNVGAVLAVGLGCEYSKPAAIAEAAERSHRPSEWFYIQEHGGTRASIAHGKELLASLRQSKEARVARVVMGWSDLVIGAECGGSDGTSGLAGNPVVGRFFDRLVDAGGTAIFEEVVEMIGLRDVLLSRAATPVVAEQLAEAYEKAMNYCRSVRQYSISPGNFAGGLTTIEEKSMGAVAKSGSRAIQGVIRVSEKPNRAGLWLLDSVPDEHFMQFGYTNPNDTEGIMDLISAGAQVVLFVTGRGSVIGCPVSPLIKITGNGRTFAAMREDIDFDASPVLTGAQCLDESAAELEQLVARVVAGEPSKPELLGHREYSFIYKHQNASPTASACK
jgi:altronate hydrolase